MRFSAVLVSLSALVASVCAQTDHQVMVGNNGTLAFSPTDITATTGDTVTFIFMAKNHTVTQSTFAAPCAAMAGGIDSGFQPVAANATQVPAMTITVNNTTPLWFFCAQLVPAAHCAGKGMVFSINATPEKSFGAFQAAATSGATASGTAAGTAATAPSGSTAAGAAASAAAASPSAALNPSSSGTASASGAVLSTSASAGSLLAILGLAAGLLL
ncbi:Cupredoxin [Amylostereum chailletii]|nr:Cupredoxin [Amylostereum chailletii]